MQVLLRSFTCCMLRVHAHSVLQSVQAHAFSTLLVSQESRHLLLAACRCGVSNTEAFWLFGIKRTEEKKMQLGIIHWIWKMLPCNCLPLCVVTLSTSIHHCHGFQPREPNQYLGYGGFLGFKLIMMSATSSIARQSRKTATTIWNSATGRSGVCMAAMKATAPPGGCTVRVSSITMIDKATAMGMASHG